MNLKETLDWYVKEGYLVAIPNGFLTLYDYTTQCALKGNWNYHTRLARGAVLDEDGNVVSRPFSKFFNLNEQGLYLQNLPKELPEVADKLDGSLVIIFQHPKNKRWVSTTRRSWNNIQTQFANSWLEESADRLTPGYTFCFELIAPWNQVVVSYPDERLILTGMVDSYGVDHSYQELEIYGKEHQVETVPYRVRRIDTIDPEDIDENQEGYVARYSNGLRVKIKGTWYLEKHKEFA